ncbi:MAG: pirin family protein [Planctomycetes bacterium]|nr:pirin family protein [Planctomycetota bacterium]
MKLQIHRADERGKTNWNWLDSRHTFSFGDYYDTDWMGFESLRVINDDRVAAGGGFPMHGHRDMEILTYIVDGALEHKDSIGTGSVIRPGELQRMTAGSGIMHSEFNASKSEPVRLLQIWIQTDRKGRKPEYQQIAIPAPGPGGASLAASRGGRGGSIELYQDAEVWVARAEKGKTVRIPASEIVAPRGRAWIQVARGSIKIGGDELSEGDGAAADAAFGGEFAATSAAEVLIFNF